MNSGETTPAIKHLKLPAKRTNSNASILSLQSKANSTENSARKSSFQKARSSSLNSTPKVLTFDDDKNKSLATRLNDALQAKLSKSDSFEVAMRQTVSSNNSNKGFK
jgi:hypothetical protein